MTNRFVMTSLALALAACAAGPPSGVPAALSPGPDETLRASVAARGVQIYECRAAASAGKADWNFVAPGAELFDDANHVVGSHGTCPFWQARDGSRVVGTVELRVDAPGTGTIPWLLLATRDSGPQGRFSGVTSIQGVNTTGGAAPVSGCDPQSVGATARVPCAADYHLSAKR